MQACMHAGSDVFDNIEVFDHINICTIVKVYKHNMNFMQTC